jgi:hypothetical protein
MNAEGLFLLLEFILAMHGQGQSLEQIFQSLAPSIAYT